MSKQLTILILLDTQERWKFFRRLARPLKEIGFNIVYMTFRPSLLLQARMCNEEIYLVPRGSANSPASVESANDVLSGNLSLDNARILYSGCLKGLGKIKGEHSIDIAFIWNGSNTADMAVSDWARENNIKCSFFEIANIPGKIFVDSKGVNAKSRLAESPEILDGLNDDLPSYEKWRKDYLAVKFQTKIVEQANAMRKFNYWATIDMFFSVFLTPPYEDVSPIVKFMRKVRHRTNVFDYDEFCITDNRYVFLPLQVSTDSQILINSDVSIEDSIAYAADYAKTNKLKLVVKPHPAEQNVAFVDNLLKMKNNYGFIFSDENIFKLMDGAESIITINSTAGLEAMILGKNVICLGRSFYKDFNARRLRQYLADYLIDIDYFSSALVGKGEVEEILMRLEPL